MVSRNNTTIKRLLWILGVAAQRQSGVTVNSERASPREAGFFACFLEEPLADAIATSGLTTTASAAALKAR